MISFHITHVDNDMKPITQNNIVVSEVKRFAYAEILNIHRQAIKVTKGKYGYYMYYHENGKIKQLYTRGTGKHINTTIKEKDTAEGHLRRIYGVADEQMELFEIAIKEEVE